MTLPLPTDQLAQATKAALRFGAVDSIALMEQEYWYRVFALYYDTLRLETRAIPVRRHTPKGVWVEDEGVTIWVSATARKRYCYPTRELAVESFIMRKRRQILLTKRTVGRAEEQLRLAESGAADLINGDTVFIRHRTLPLYADESP